MKRLQIITLMLVGMFNQAGKADQSRQFLDHDDLPREYQLYVPSSYEKARRTPLLIILHGRSSNGQRMADLSSFNSRADLHGFIAVYPEGINKQWNYLHGISGFNKQPNDSEFLLKIVEAVRSKYNVDDKRIYATGISNGGFMVQRLACYAPDKFAAFASVAAGGYAAMPAKCVDKGPVNLLYMHGTADEKVPWQGLGITDDSGNQQLVTLSIANSVKFWANRNQCSPDVTRKEIPTKGDSSGTRVQILSSNDCDGNAEVVLYAIMGGGHNWPGAPNIIPPSIAGRVNMDIHASDVIWSFFSSKKLR
jgi:polyhydroxybutyrate depolymerase